MRRHLRPALLGLAVMLALAPVRQAAADTCSADDFGDAVDTSAAELRAFSAETQPKLKLKLQTLRDSKRWTDADYESKGLALVHDGKLDEFDAKAGELLGRIDTLGTPEQADAATSTSCADLAELKAASSELMSVMRAKSEYLIAKIDREIGPQPAGAPSAPPPPVAAAEPPAAPKAAAPPAPADEQPSLSPVRRSQTAGTEPPRAEPKRQAEAAPESPPPPAAEREPAPPKDEPKKQAEAPDKAPPGQQAGREQDKTSSWSTTTAQAVVPPPAMRRPAPPPSEDLPPAFDPPSPGDPPGAPYELPPPGEQVYDPAAEDGYSIDEIRQATQGFFGTISTSLASVIEHAFQKSGRPTAYVLGTEGGGAFLAGLRYGQGTLFLRSGGTQQVYWHGPSIGYDMGAEGSRTLFLIYDLAEPDGIFRRFTGVDGSAYLVGGVGMTLLKGGPVVMAPIRSGIGLRLGASIGYLRFTPRPTWNPF